DDDRGHDFPEQVRRRIIMDVLFGNGVHRLAGVSHAAPADRDWGRGLLSVRQDVLNIDVERLGQPDQLVIGERHLPVFELRKRGIRKAGASRERAQAEPLLDPHVADRTAPGRSAAAAESIGWKNSSARLSLFHRSTRKPLPFWKHYSNDATNQAGRARVIIGRSIGMFLAGACAVAVAGPAKAQQSVATTPNAHPSPDQARGD